MLLADYTLAQNIPLETQRTETHHELREVSTEISSLQEKFLQLDNEIAALKKDRTTITNALLQSAKLEKKLAEDMQDITARLALMYKEEDEIKHSFQERRNILAEILAALQRMGLNPPPAILVHPDDALTSVRSAVLLGAVVPEIREQTETLMHDFKEINRLTTSIAEEKNRLSATKNAQIKEQRRLSLLLVEKKKLQAQSEDRLAEDRKRSEELAQRAQSLQELIVALDSQMLNAKKNTKNSKPRSNEQMDPAAPLLGPQVDFTTLRGRLMLPATGKISVKFGDKNSLIGNSMGEMLETAANTTITSPSDGVVLYANGFRSYGQLLILDVGGGYRIVLAGMKRVDVSQGQFIRAGEPIGVMGEKFLTSSATMNVENSLPMLYIEFRKDGKPVDPSLWWAVQLSEGTQNDT